MTRQIESLESKLEHRMIDMGKKLEAIMQFICAQSSPTASLDEIGRSICVDQSSSGVSQENLFSRCRKVESGLEETSRAAEVTLTSDEQVYPRCRCTDTAAVNSNGIIPISSFQGHRSCAPDAPMVHAPVDTAQGEAPEKYLGAVPAAEESGTALSDDKGTKTSFKGTPVAVQDRRTEIVFSCRCRQLIQSPAMPVIQQPAMPVPGIKKYHFPPSVHIQQCSPYNSCSDEITAEVARGGTEVERQRRMSVMVGVVTGLKYGVGNDDVEEEARDGWAGLSVVGCVACDCKSGLPGGAGRVVRIMSQCG